MVSRLGQLYAKRIVNVNVNIVLASLLAIALTVGIVHLAGRWGFTNWISRRLAIKHEFAVNGITFVADIFCDVAIYFVLHWLANHWPRRAAQKLHLPQPHPIHPTFFKDATMVQVERMTLSPLLYVLWLGLQHMLLVRGMSLGLATFIGGAIGIATTRFLHTLWMLRQQRRWAAKAALAVAAAQAAAAPPPSPAAPPVPPVPTPSPSPAATVPPR